MIRLQKSKTSDWPLLILSCGLFGLAGLSNVRGEILHQETFETDGDGSRYELNDPGFEFTGDSGPGVFGLNFDADQIGLQQNAPAKRAAILWSHDMFPEDPAPESLEVWLSLVEWAVENKPAAKVGFFPGYEFADGSLIIAELLEASGYELEEVIDPADVSDDFDVVIHTSEAASTAFSELPVPLISFSGSDHDDTAIAGIGSAVEFLDPVVLTVPTEHEGHPVLGGKTGEIPWTTEFTTLQTIGKLHNGGKAIGITEDPDTGEDTAALFVIEAGDPLLGAFNPDPEGEGYLVGAALNKFGDGGERTLEIGPLSVSGKDDLSLTAALAATAADFEPGDYLRVEVELDGDPIVLDEFWGVSQAGDCLKGLSNGEVPGEEGEICLPETEFEDFSWTIPAGGDELIVRFAMLSTWGNEIIGIDNVRLASGGIGPTGDFNGSGDLDAGDLDALADGMLANDLAFDLNADGGTDYEDRKVWVKELKRTWIGDSNLDGQFNSSDFVLVFQEGKFETGETAGWTQGDWNGDKVFDSGDFVAAFTDGGFERGVVPAVNAVPEPSSAVLLIIATSLLGSRIRRRHRS
ncbi:MAG: PEP-CTERM sorting domain-containing protein [Pirellulaceae bacterium]|nr:PEP-CTERM sorting domain-containing protein [Pirellulaceae bacterium]